ncbi:hypothetical protein [Geobacter pickeringii]|nr:hypothetical protein [Geobacter pickeringii]
MRAAELIADLQSHSTARIRLSPDFDQGLKEVFDNRPVAVFIQSEISGISGETVARHIKTLLRGDAPRIVLVHSAPLKPQGGKKWFDGTVDLALPEAELRESFRAEVTAASAGLWQESPAVDAVNPTPVAGFSLQEEEAAAPSVSEVASSPEQGREFEFFDWETPASASAPATSAEPPPAPPVVPEVEEFHPILASDGRMGEPEPSVPPEAVASLPVDLTPAEFVPPAAVTPADVAVPVAVPAPETPPVEPAAPPPVPDQRRLPTVADFNAETIIVPPPEPLDPPGATAAETACGGNRVLFSSVAGVALVAAVCAGVYFYSATPRTELPERKPAGTVPAPPPAPAPHPPSPAPVPAASSPGLPAFIPAAHRDAAYTKTNPGWERYVAKTREFRLFRENGALRAVQIIPRGSAVLPEGVVDGALKDLTGAPSRTVLTRSVTGKYLVERGRTAGNGEFVAYRQKRGGLRGVVISLP